MADVLSGGMRIGSVQTVIEQNCLTIFMCRTESCTVGPFGKEERCWRVKVIKGTRCSCALEDPDMGTGEALQRAVDELNLNRI